MHRRWFAGMTVLLLVLVAGATVSAAERPAVGPEEPQQQDPPQIGTPEGFNNTVFEIVVYENGSARWTIVHSTVLENDSEESQFGTYASRFNSTETETFQKFRTRATALADFGTDNTDREMNASDFSKEAAIEPRIQRTVGVIRMSFLWSNFAQVDGDRVVVDDVFEGGMFVDSGQRLVIGHGPNLVFSSVDPAPDRPEVGANLTAADTVEWTGRKDFQDERPKVVMVQPGGPPTTVTTATPATTGTATVTATATPTVTPASATTSGFGPLPIVLALLLLLVIAVALAYYSGGLDDLLGSDSGGGTDAPAEPSTETDSTAEPESPTEPETTESPAEPTVPDEELLSDEDRVLQLLDDNGGRMKQVNIVDETEWSKSKVSMLLSDMEEEGDISKLRVGRENIISKAGEEPDAVGSPFDDE